MDDRHAALQRRLGHAFGDPGLMLRALTHRSFGADHNERLEFLGDAVLSLAISGLLYADQGRVRLRGYELFKALRGHTTHEAELDLPVVPNSQDMDTLTASVDAVLTQPNTWGYLIAGHGLYAWGRDIAEARRHLDAFEFMLGCELELRRMGAR